MRDRAYRRYMNEVKTKRKLKYNQLSHLEDCPGKLRKGKNFCSCSCCTPKTNLKGKTYFGHTKIRYSTRNWKVSDKKKIDKASASLNYWEDSSCRYYMEWDYDLVYDEKPNGQWLYINGDLILRRKSYKKR